jgi:hypothetical protein
MQHSHAAFGFGWNVRILKIGKLRNGFYWLLDVGFADLERVEQKAGMREEGI